MKETNLTTNSVVDPLRPTHVEVFLNRLSDNYHAIDNWVGDAQVMPILKANAYGHGLVPVAKLMDLIGAKYIGVAILEEGKILREAGIKIPILVLGGIVENQIPFFLKHKLTLTAYSTEILNKIDQAADSHGVKAKVHLKIDTGMGRLGVGYQDAATLFADASKCKHIDVEGVFSHFANSDTEDLASAKLQLERFNEAMNFYNEKKLPMPIRHMANSGAIVQLADAHMDLVRPGILLYGVFPSNEVNRSIDVKPALSWKTRSVHSKLLKPGHPVSYGSTWKSDHEVQVVTLPVGYGDGYMRSMSGKAYVIIRGNRYPVIGRITMDQVMVNIESDPARVEDEVVLVGKDGSEKIGVEELAQWAGTIPYEILTNINTRVPRVYLENG